MLCPDGNTANMKVSSLVDKDLWCWNLDIPKEYIREDEFRAIEEIPLLRNNQPDKSVWPYEKKGEVTIKSTYVH